MTLMQLVMDLAEAKTRKEKEKAYSRLRRVGVDQMTADLMAYHIWEVRAELKSEGVKLD